MLKEEFKISNREFRNQLLYVLSEDNEVLDKIKNLVTADEKSELEVRPTKKELDLKNGENKELDHLRMEISEKNGYISELEFKVKQLEEGMKLFEKLTESYDALMSKFKKTEENNEKLKSKSESLEEKVDKYKNENETFLQDNRKMKESEDSYRDKLVKSVEEGRELKERLKGYENQFADMIEVHKKYLQLTTRSKESLSGIFKDESLMGFVACGIQESNIESLWDYIKDEIKEEKYEGVNELKEILEYLFNLYQLSNPKYGWQEVEAGVNFDTDEHIRHSSGKVSGEVAEVMLKGYENKKNGRIIRKSLVKVG